VIKKTVKV